MLRGESNEILSHASASQRARVFMAERLHVGHIFTRLVVQAEICDELNPESADPHVSPTNLLQLNDDLAKFSDDRDKYNLLTKRVAEYDPTDKRVWFDVIVGLTEPKIVSAVAKAAKELLPAERTKWENAADLGAGTGQLSALLTHTAENIVAVDRVPEMLTLAADRNGKGTKTVAGDVLRTPFPDESFELIVSGGLVYLLGHENQNDYFGEVNRLLKPGGIYLDGDQSKSHGITNNWGRFALCDFIKSQLSGSEILGDPLGAIENKHEYFSQFGLDLSERKYDDPPFSPLIVRVLQKTGDARPDPKPPGNPWDHYLDRPV